MNSLRRDSVVALGSGVESHEHWGPSGVRSKGKAMSQTDPDKLEQLYKEWPIQKLARALAVECDQYEPKAILAMRRAMESHALSQEQLATLFDDIASEDRVATDRLSHIRGLLLLFIVLVGMMSVVYLLSAFELTFAFSERRGEVFMYSIDEQHVQFGSAFSGVDWPDVIVAALTLASFGLYGLYSCFLLLRRSNRATRHVRLWLTRSCGLFALVGVFHFIRSGEVYIVAAAPAVFTLMWLTYLSDSKRVALVYGSQEPTDPVASSSTDRRSGLDPVWWTSSERRIRCPQWQPTEAGVPGGSTQRSSEPRPRAWSWMRARRWAPSRGSWISPRRPCGFGSTGRAPIARAARPA